jgi:hypothetical protein
MTRREPTLLAPEMTPPSLQLFFIVTKVLLGIRVFPVDLFNRAMTLLMCRTIGGYSEWEIRYCGVSCSVIITYKGVAFVAKTSFDQEFARFGPGIYLMNVAIRELFEERRVHKIDFISDVPFTRTWASTHLRRIGFTMTSRTGMSRIVMSLFRGNAFGRAFRRRVLTFTFLFPSAVDVFPFLDLL